MKKAWVGGVWAFALIACAATTIGAPQTKYPGEMTEPRVIVRNHGRGEAVPVDVRDVNLEKPLRVHVTNGEAGAGDVLQTRATRQLWEYETAIIPAGRDLAAALNARGAAGWEAVGTTAATSESVTVLLKRPR
jgi:hypothetical protein